MAASTFYIPDATHKHARGERPPRTSVGKKTRSPIDTAAPPMHAVTPINHEARLLSSATELNSNLDAPTAHSRILAELTRRRCILGAVLLADAVGSLLLVLVSVGFEFGKLSHMLFGTDYRLSDSLLDSLIITTIRTIALASQHPFGWWVGFAGTTLAICKAIVYRYAGRAAAATILTAAVAGVLELLLCARCVSTMDRRLALEKLFAAVQAEAGAGGAAADPGAFEGKVEALVRPKKSSLRGMWKILRPYFLPTGWLPKLRTAATFVIMAGSKGCNLLSPLAIGRAAQTLADGRVPYADLGMYCALRFGSSALSELQKLVYIRVKQTAFAEIAETTFRHLLGLSLDWHLRKKMGEVLRVMDRGISSADSVMNYLILFLAPSIAECLVTLCLFFTHFRSPELSATALLSFVIYTTLTINITQWRKKFRTGQNKSDNRYHDIATDSLVNFETVKYFANEELECRQFSAAVKSFQAYNIGVQASLSLLNSSQQLDIQLTTLAALCLAASAILHQRATPDEPVQIGEFVSVNAYVLQLFAPLSFLGTIYSTVVQAFIDMGNLSDLLLISPDVKDAPHAPPLRLGGGARGGARGGGGAGGGAQVEFVGVDFSYPTQKARGLRGLSFVTPAGSTTAIVGPTGAGKSTISRLLFRFYDVDAGQILVDGQNVSAVTQKSLRSAVGVVPQDTVLVRKRAELALPSASPRAPCEAQRGRIRHSPDDHLPPCVPKTVTKPSHPSPPPSLPPALPPLLHPLLHPLLAFFPHSAVQHNHRGKHPVWPPRRHSVRARGGCAWRADPAADRGA